MSYAAVESGRWASGDRGVKRDFWKQGQHNTSEVICDPQANCSSSIGFQRDDNRRFIFDVSLRCGYAEVTYATAGQS